MSDATFVDAMTERLRDTVFLNRQINDGYRAYPVRIGICTRGLVWIEMMDFEGSFMLSPAQIFDAVFDGGEVIAVDQDV